MEKAEITVIGAGVVKWISPEKDPLEDILNSDFYTEVTISDRTKGHFEPLGIMLCDLIIMTKQAEYFISNFTFVSW